MATTSSEAVKLWDLRKLRNLETLAPFKGERLPGLLLRLAALLSTGAFQQTHAESAVGWLHCGLPPPARGPVAVLSPCKLG